MYSAVACNLDRHLLQAALPLFAAGKVEAIEWSFDALYKRDEIPSWFFELLEEFAQKKRLIGHGIQFSIFQAKWTTQHQEWLDHLAEMCRRFRFDHLSEHFGFMSGRNFYEGAPMPVPLTATTLAIGRDRLSRIADVGQCPVGVENLAFAFSTEEVKRHGEFLDALVNPINGFLILDLHNLYCHVHNFKVDFLELLNYYPLHRVREIHVSGGSWEQTAGGRKIRRDTHDDRVPEEVFQMLEEVVDKCPNLRFVVLEQMGTALQTAQSKEQFRVDFERLTNLLDPPPNATNLFLPSQVIGNSSSHPITDTNLLRQEEELATILETAETLDEASCRLALSSLAHSEWAIERWSADMIGTAMAIAKKWKKGG